MEVNEERRKNDEHLKFLLKPVFTLLDLQK